MSEARLWSWLRGRIGHLGHFTRVENRVEKGTPDVSFSIPGLEGWLELKHSRRVLETTCPFSKYGLRREQELWISERVRSGGRVMIVAAVGDEILWVPGAAAEAFNSLTLGELRRRAVSSYKRRQAPDHDRRFLIDLFELS